MQKTNEGIVFSRQELYDLLTEKPVSKIVEEYNLQYKSMIGEIERHLIPRRASSDWTRLAMNLPVYRAPLRGNPASSVFVKFKQTNPNVKASNNTDAEYTGSPKPADYYANLRREQTSQQNNSESAPQPINPGSAVANSGLRSNKKRNLEAKYDIDNYEPDQTLYHELGYTPNEEYNKITVYELSLSVRAMNALLRANLLSLHIIMSTRIVDLIGIRNLGRITLLEVIQACDQFCKRHPIEPRPQDQKTIDAGLPKSEQNDNQAGSTLGSFILDYCKLNSTGQLVAREMLSTLTKLKQFQKTTDED